MSKMEEASTGRMYDVWAWFYDRTFGRLVTNRQRRAVLQLPLKPGEVVLDLGVGTGLTLGYYPKDVTIIGMDLSGGMLAKAATKKADLGLDDCLLIKADAMFPPFADQSFDHILISHTISVVSDPSRLVRWACRLVKPGGRIVLLNHFQSSQPVIAWFERVLNPIFVKIGWRSDLALEDVLRQSDLDVEYRFKTTAFDLWQIVVLRQPERGRRVETIETASESEQMPSSGLLAMSSRA